MMMLHVCWLSLQCAVWATMDSPTLEKVGSCAAAAVLLICVLLLCSQATNAQMFAAV
jgi:hypothetical protein